MINVPDTHTVHHSLNIADPQREAVLSHLIGTADDNKEGKRLLRGAKKNNTCSIGRAFVPYFGLAKTNKLL